MGSLLSPQVLTTPISLVWLQPLLWNLVQWTFGKNSSAKFQAPALWALYKWYILLAAVAVLFEAFLVVWLLISRNQRRKTELESRKLAGLVDADHKLLGEVVSSVPGIVWETRIDPSTGQLKVTFVSDHLEKMLGYKVDDWLSKQDIGLEIVNELDRERVAAEFHAILLQTNQKSLRFRCLTLDGSTLWVEAQLVPILDDEGKVVGVRGVTLDITEQQLTEEARRQSEERNRALLQAVPDLMFLQTRDGVYLDYHAKDPGMLQVPPDVFLGRNMSDVLPPHLAETFLDHFQRAETGEPQIIDYELETNGTRSWFEARIVRSGDNILSVVRDVSSRKLSEIALKENEAQLAGIIGSAMDAIITVDENHRVVLFNATAERLFLCSAAEALGQSLDRFLPERFLKANGQDIRLFAERDVTQRMGLIEDLYGLRTSGEEFPIDASISQIELGGKKFNTLILRDITKRKQAIDELRHSEQRFAKSFRANPQPMSLTTIEGGLYLDVNESFLQMSGYTREEVIGHTSLELRIWETPEARANFLGKIKKEGSIVNVETKFRTKPGSLRVLLSSAEQLDIGGQECLLVASSDVTERVAAQQALRETEERFRNMADTAPVLIWMADEAKAHTYFNRRWLDFTGRRMDEEIDDGWTKGVHHDDYAHYLQIYTTKFDQREQFEIEYRLLRHDGLFRWIFDSGTPRFSAEGLFLGYIGSCLDITERKENEVALQKAHKELHQLKNKLEAENVYLQEELLLDRTFGEIVGQSDAIKYVLFTVTQVAPTDSTVLVTGETGTGKELVARAIHSESHRKDRPFIKVNCGALSPTLIESELFGHEKGAFTGASNRKLGRFELANGGTLFLDEIGELPTELQVKLLRVIQENEFERLGGNKTIKVDVRLIAATNRNLKQDVEMGKFREDLWYRLNVYPITVPPLRQRKEDIPLLVEHFVRRYAKKSGKAISEVSLLTMQMLQTHSWPGNVRELANAIERAVINTKGSVLETVDRFEPTAEEERSSLQTLQELEHDYIVRTLENTGWRIEGTYGAAKILGLNPSTLRTRLQKLGIQRRRAGHAREHFSEKLQISE